MSSNNSIIHHPLSLSVNYAFRAYSQPMFFTNFDFNFSRTVSNYLSFYFLYLSELISVLVLLKQLNWGSIKDYLILSYSVTVLEGLNN